ncbi:uncharacterized protein LOC6554934 isoform X2 [Drosophila erecta]|uniref:GG12260 n=1 Tax=Drosophila erecta TaxID=7220 RepID=B3P6L3_DROER|nr:uncharacterized protein LOC6554934 isoform X2 [Drosophila erecta]EDV53683.1 uncharacterized protein Dere_GG12260, isoform A [Drosophila erecta]KQS52274.1 uncharacterized protein Dere_GG12260, isoform B [Drosophila erecta]
MKVPKIPEWVSALSLNQAVHSVLEDGDQIMTVIPGVHLIQFRNCTVLLPIRVKVQLRDSTVKNLFFVLKAQHGSDLQAMVMNQLKMFQREHQVYHNVLPKFEELYREVGKEVSFGPRAFKLDYNIGVQYVLLEDLKSKHYKNVVRQDGFNKLCLKQVLKKLAQFHAASAVCVERHGAFSKLLTNGVYTKANQSILQDLNDPDTFLSQLRRWRLGDHFHKRLVEKEKDLVDGLLLLHSTDSNEFNVLNHCDCWVNNVMFKFDQAGHVEDTALLDFQLAKYGSPALDLYYTILSSAEKDIKLAQFDNMVQYYFYHLLENLRALNFRGSLPQLEHIRDALNKNGLAAYVVVTRALPITMMNQFEDEVNERYASKMKCAMFTSRKYIQAMKDILPWMEERSLLN